MTQASSFFESRISCKTRCQIILKFLVSEPPPRSCSESSKQNEFGNIISNQKFKTLPPSLGSSSSSTFFVNSSILILIFLKIVPDATGVGSLDERIRHGKNTPAYLDLLFSVRKTSISTHTPKIPDKLAV